MTPGTTTFTILLILGGAVAAYESRHCTPAFPKHSTIFKIPIWAIGFLGYVAMFAMVVIHTPTSLSIYGPTAIGAAIFTCFLMARSISHKIACIPCMVTWIINFLLPILCIFDWPQ